MTKYVGLDFETYGEVDLPKHGLNRYVNGPDFRPLLAAVAWSDHYQSRRVYNSYVYDLAKDDDDEKAAFFLALEDATIVAHNAGFEQAVLRHMGLDLPSSRFIDSAVVARAAGVGGKLEAAGPQLLGLDKLETGLDLIRLFSIPGKYQEAAGNTKFDPAVRMDNMDKWIEFMHYCSVDAELSLRIWLEHGATLSTDELANTALTMDMNNTGWHVDQHMVKIMQLRYQTNLVLAEQDFRRITGAAELNLSSPQQLVAWCAARGVKLSSLDKDSVDRTIPLLERRLARPRLDAAKHADYTEVLALLRTKQILGGTSLKKLQTIIDTVGVDGRLHDQYLHIGAGATRRTTGKGVQMQNLKRLNGEGNDMEELFDVAIEWDNTKLSANLRQVFTASHPGGQLIVGDFSSVESRGLAWQAGENWKLEAYRRGEDLYKVLAGVMFHKSADVIVKSERQIGKTGELACGYQAGPGAVRSFAEKMGISLTEAEAIKLVRDWRNADPATVEYWYALDDALRAALEHRVVQQVAMPHGYVEIFPRPAPESLRKQVSDPDLLSLVIRMYLNDGTELLQRVVHGTHIVGRSIYLWKPSELKGGPLWRARKSYLDPVTGTHARYDIYGGKLAGLLTQSLCREMFFDSLRKVHYWVAQHDNVQLVGQFHDEIVLDWVPENSVKDAVQTAGLVQTMGVLEQCMTSTKLPDFPLAAEIKSDYRYTK